MLRQPLRLVLIVLVVAVITGCLWWLAATFLPRQVTIKTVPQDVTISESGKTVGSSKNSFRLQPGTHHLSLSADGFRTRELIVTIANGKNEFHAALTPSTESKQNTYDSSSAYDILYKDDLEHGGIYAHISGSSDQALRTCDSYRHDVPAICFYDSSTPPTEDQVKKILGMSELPLPLSLYEIYPVSDDGTIVYQDADVTVLCTASINSEADPQCSQLVAYSTSNDQATVTKKLTDSGINMAFYTVEVVDPNSASDDYDE